MAALKNLTVRCLNNERPGKNKPQNSSGSPLMWGFNCQTAAPGLMTDEVQEACYGQRQTRSSLKLNQTVFKFTWAQPAELWCTFANSSRGSIVALILNKLQKETCSMKTPVTLQRVQVLKYYPVCPPSPWRSSFAHWWLSVAGQRWHHRHSWAHGHGPSHQPLKGKKIRIRGGDKGKESSWMHLTSLNNILMIIMSVKLKKRQTNIHVQICCYWTIFFGHQYFTWVLFFFTAFSFPLYTNICTNIRCTQNYLFVICKGQNLEWRTFLYLLLLLPWHISKTIYIQWY